MPVIPRYFETIIFLTWPWPVQLTALETKALRPLITYLNINSLSNKIDALRQICKISPLERLCVDKTKLDSSFPNSQYRIHGYIFPLYQRDRENHRVC